MSRVSGERRAGSHLLGQIVNSYGKREIGEKDGKSAFVQLIEAVHEIEGLERIRFTSPHPKGYGDDLVDAYVRLPKLMENAHLPVQSGSDRMLKLMHRGYTRDRFLELVGKLRTAAPEMGVGTDIIVGFPGETESDFEETMSLAARWSLIMRSSSSTADVAIHLPRRCRINYLKS